jgi:hypothetical protein
VGFFVILLGMMRRSGSRFGRRDERAEGHGIGSADGRDCSTDDERQSDDEIKRKTWMNEMT